MATDGNWLHLVSSDCSPHQGLQFLSGGTLKTPWGIGQWGRVRSMPGDVLFADFIGQQHVVRLSPAGWPTLVSTRCADFENVTVTVEQG
jgi:hypothetical protein